MRFGWLGGGTCDNCQPIQRMENIKNLITWIITAAACMCACLTVFMCVCINGTVFMCLGNYLGVNQLPG